MKRYILFLLSLLVLWMVVFLMAVTGITSRADQPKDPAKPCLKCREVYKKCLIKVIESNQDDEDARMQCDDAYYACFYKNKCQAGGR